MTVSTTFGYNATEDRLWMSCSAWPQRIWITRRMTGDILRAVARAIEDGAAESASPLPLSQPAAPAVAAAERAATEHDAAINRPPPGEGGYALRMGSEAANAAPLKEAPLCVRFSLTRRGPMTDLTFHAATGEWRLHLSRTGLHRWLHALHLVIGPTRWHEGLARPDWLTRSYLPPALKALLTAPPSEAK
jgi:hypothetical protein